MWFSANLFFGLLATISLVFEVSAAAGPDKNAKIFEVRAVRTIVQSLQHCSTSSCIIKPKTLRRTTKTIHQKTSTTIWKRIDVGTRTVVNPSSTRTVKVSLPVILRTITYNYVIVTLTQSFTTTVGAPKYTTVTSYTSASGVATVTKYPPTVTIPAPGGNFTAILDDPRRLTDFPGIVPVFSKKKRDALPEPEPAAVKRYPKSVYCTKTLKTVVQVTSTTTLAGTTITVAGRTRTLSGSTIFFTTAAATATSLIRMKRVTSTIFTVRNSTITTTIGNYSSTVFVAGPTPTYYAGCGPRNQAPPPGTAFNLEGWNPSPGRLDFGPDVYIDFFLTNGTGYDCCVSCHTLPASQGECLGSFWTFRGFWHVPPCVINPDGSPGLWCDPPGDARGDCTLHIRRPGSSPTCPKIDFITLSGISVPTVMSNGPGCPFWWYTGVKE